MFVSAEALEREGKRTHQIIEDVASPAPSAIGTTGHGFRQLIGAIAGSDLNEMMHTIRTAAHRASSNDLLLSFPFEIWLRMAFAFRRMITTVALVAAQSLYAQTLLLPDLDPHERDPSIQLSVDAPTGFQGRKIEPTTENAGEPSLYRVTPPTVQEFQQPLTWKMELGEALYIALENNRDINVSRYVPELAATEVMQEQKRFDTEVLANHHWALDQRRLASNITTLGSGSDFQSTGSYGQPTGHPDQLALSRTLRSGTALRTGFSTGFNNLTPIGAFNTLNPNWRSTLGFEVSQPLGQGRGERVQTLPIRIARAYQATTKHDFQQIVLKLLRDVEHSYWNVAHAHQNLEVRRKNVVEARKTFEKELEKQLIGESSRPEIGEARLHYHHMVDLYHMRKSELLEDERAFRELLGLPGFDNRRIEISLPETPPDLEVDWEWSVASMLEMRPDLISQRFSTKSAKLRYELACDKCKPELNLVGRVGKSGLARDFDRSLDRMLSEEDYGVLVGFHYKRDVNRWGARAETRRAYLQWCQQQSMTDQMEFAAVHSLQQAYEQLYQKMDRVEQLKNLREAAQERLAAYKEKFDLGELAIELYLRAQAADADADLMERSAKVELMQAIVHFEYVRGTLLQARSIIIEERTPDVSDAEDAEGDLLLLPEASGPSQRPTAPDFPELLKKASPDVKRMFIENDSP